MVVWTDAFFDYDEQDATPEDFEVTTLGFVIRRGPKFLSLAAESLPEGNRAITHIPIALIRSERSLLLGPPKVNP